jgi:hypothetical protein
MRNEVLRVLALLLSGMAFPPEPISFVSPPFLFTDQLSNIRAIYNTTDRTF